MKLEVAAGAKFIQVENRNWKIKSLVVVGWGEKSERREEREREREKKLEIKF